MRSFTRHSIVRNKDRGAVLAWVAILLFCFIAFTGFAIDYGYIYFTGQRLQNAADAAALAGAHQIHEDPSAARAAAKAVASANEAGGATVELALNTSNVSTGDIVLGVYDKSSRTFTASSDSATINAVLVNARRQSGSLNGALPLFFGALLGRSNADVARWAIAFAEGGPANADVIALNSKDAQSFYLYGNGYLDLLGGKAQVNSTHKTQAVLFQGSSITYKFGSMDIVGHYDERGNPQIPNLSDIHEDEDAIADPLATLPEPVPADYVRNNSKINGGTSASPKRFASGYYPNGLDLQAGHSVILEPGVYVIDNGFQINGNATLKGSGVMIFLRTGSVKDNGTGQVYLTPPTSGTYANIQFFQARTNTTMATFNGTSTWKGAATDDTSTTEVNEATAGTGTLYFPKATVELGGTGDMWVNGLISDKIIVYGSGRKTVTGGYNGEEGTGSVYIVE